MIGAPVPGVVNALQVTIPGRSLSPQRQGAGERQRRKKNLKILLQSFTCKIFMSGAMTHLSFISNYSPHYSRTPDNVQ